MKSKEEIEQLAEKWFLINQYNQYDKIHSHRIPECITTKNLFIKGYTQCQKDNADKKYTEEDMEKCWYNAMDIAHGTDDFPMGIDNLFKFLGLSGLIIVAFSLVYPKQIQKEIDFNIIDYNKQKSILLKEIEHIKLKVYDLQQDTLKAKIKVHLLALQKDSLISIGKNLSAIKDLDFQKEEIKTELGKKFDSLEELIFQESLKSIELKSTEEKITTAQSYLSEYKSSFWILLVIGFVMCLIFENLFRQDFLLHR